MKKLKKALALLSLVFLTACSNKNQATDLEIQEEASSETSEAKEDIEEKDVHKFEESTVTIRSIGDILIHDEVYYEAQLADGSYDFTPMFEAVKPYIQNADITLANLEVIAAGQEIGVSSYPIFNAPIEILDALVDCGVDIVNNATNHTMDRGPEGALLSLENLDKYGIKYVGSYKDWQDYNTHRIIEKNGIKVGFLSYSYGANGNWIPEDQQYLLSLIDQDLMELEVEYLKSKCDVGVVIIHSGEEYENYPAQYQIDLNQAMSDAGANLIVGGHPHHLQPFEYYNESSVGMYSHGNFLSGQYELETKLGGISEYTFKRDKEGKITIDSMRFMPTYNIGYPDYNYFKVIPLADGEEYGLWAAEELYLMLEERMTAYTDKVEVVRYLD